MAALFPKIYDVIDQNPHKHVTLRCVEPISTEGLMTEAWASFTLRPLDPPGILSLLLIWSDPMYELGTPSLRKQILRESLLTLHERIDKELIGRRYPRKKIQDLLANQLSAESPVSTPVLHQALAELFQVQLLHIDRKAKSICFSPEDPRIWQFDRPIYLTGDDYRWVFVPTVQQSIQDWLLQKETEGWQISWPTADGKFEDLKALAIEQKLLTVHSPKEKKEDLAKRVGRTQSLLKISDWTFST